MIGRVIALFLLLTASYGQSERNASDSEVNMNQSIRFLQIGDWGGIRKPPYYSKSQILGAQGMNKVAMQQGSQFVISSGDNFYDYGVTSIKDKRFNATWMDVYGQQPNLRDLPWYMIAGNHDHETNVSAQIAYSSVSSTWKFPSLYHKQSFASADGTVSLDIVFIDTYLLTGTISGSSYPKQIKDMKQYAWLVDILKLSKADYIIVNGHYPIYSPCSYGNTRTLISHLQPLLESYRAHYVSGHEHCIADMEIHGIHYFLNGIGNDCCYARHKIRNVPADSLRYLLAQQTKTKKGGMDGIYSGFSSFHVTKERMKVAFYDQDGHVLHESVVLPRPRNTTTNANDSADIDALSADMLVMSPMPDL
jgi:tartrate-resistant acid phosphatase type 5